MPLTLEEIEEAILKVLVNQSYTIVDTTYTRANLEGLRLMRKELRAEQKEEALEKKGGSLFDRAILVTPRRP